MENNKKKSIVFFIIAIVTLLIAVAGATYAYFTTQLNNNANLTLNGSLADSSQVFTTYSTGDILFENITAEDMTLNNNGLLQTKNATITVELTAGSDTTCTYDLVFNWNNGKAYTPSTERGNALELSYQITGAGDASSVAESQIKTGIILDEESITSKDGNKSTNTYNVTMKFYNLTTPQNELGGKEFQGKWEINDIKCSAKKPVKLTDNLAGYYADTNNDGTVDGVIFFDYMYGADTTTGATFLYANSSKAQPTVVVEPITEGLNTYELKTVEGHENVVVPTSSDKHDRFYVIDLEDSLPVAPLGTNLDRAYWHYSAFSTKISDYATVTSTDFGSGKGNTDTMKEKWNAEYYGAKNKGDIWSINMGDKFILSKDELLVLGSNFKKLDSDAAYNSTTSTLDLSFPSGATLSFNPYYWSSSLDNSDHAWYAAFNTGYMFSDNLNYFNYFRLASVF